MVLILDGNSNLLRKQEGKNLCGEKVDTDWLLRDGTPIRW